jgi:hypothetical protein
MLNLSQQHLLKQYANILFADRLNNSNHFTVKKQLSITIEDIITAYHSETSANLLFSLFATPKDKPKNNLFQFHIKNGNYRLPQLIFSQIPSGTFSEVIHKQVQTLAKQQAEITSSILLYALELAIVYTDDDKKCEKPYYFLILPITLSNTRYPIRLATAITITEEHEYQFSHELYKIKSIYTAPGKAKPSLELEAKVHPCYINIKQPDINFYACFVPRITPKILNKSNPETNHTMIVSQFCEGITLQQFIAEQTTMLLPKQIVLLFLHLTIEIYLVHCRNCYLKKIDLTHFLISPINFVIRLISLEHPHFTMQIDNTRTSHTPPNFASPYRKRNQERHTYTTANLEKIKSFEIVGTTGYRMLSYLDKHTIISRRLSAAIKIPTQPLQLTNLDGQEAKSDVFSIGLVFLHILLHCLPLSRCDFDKFIIKHNLLNEWKSYTQHSDAENKVTADIEFIKIKLLPAIKLEQKKYHQTSLEHCLYAIVIDMLNVDSIDKAERLNIPLVFEELLTICDKHSIATKDRIDHYLYEPYLFCDLAQ